MPQKGKQFEKAVYEFVKALSPNSEVFYDYKVRDIHTKQLRQVDAWIVTRILGHIPITILVSCKDYTRKLNISHIETFRSEISSVSASAGVIYSSSGFSQGALEKAECYGINCCQLFTGKPVPLPQKLVFHSYVCRPRISINIDDDNKRILIQKGVHNWDEFFRIVVEEGITILDAINEAYIKIEKEAISKENLKNMLPSNWKVTLRFSEINDENNIITITINGMWAIFKGKTECHLFNGSYCFKNNSYIGNMRGPVIDTYSFHPGTDWIEVMDKKNLLNANMVAIFTKADIKASLLNHYKGKEMD